MTQAHIDLFDVYHQDMHRRRDWPLRHVSAEEYASAFLAPGYYDEDFAREFRYYDGDRLVGVGLVDILPTCASSIYFYHAPDWRPRAPGTYSLMKEIQYCQTRQIEHHYLGYWVPGCPSMDYTARYGPHQILLGRPEADQGAHWIGVADP